MYRVAVKMLGETNAVCDIVQEVFVYLYENENNIKQIINYSAWLYRATYYKCVDYLKQQSRFSTLDVVKDRSSDEEPYNKKEAKAMIQRALNKLDTKVRFLVVLYSEGLSYKEMAEVTEIPYTSIGKTLSRTLKKLEKELKEEYYELF